MPKTSAFWHPSHRKEVFDLLRTVWPTLDQTGRDTLAANIVAGPPEHLFERYEGAERIGARDRRIFDRIAVLENVGKPPLTEALATEARRLHNLYPNWRAPEGEKAHFGTWSESRWGRDSKFSAEQLKSIGDAELIALLHEEQEDREGLLDAWRKVAGADPIRVMGVLGAVGSEDLTKADIWNYAVGGFRDTAKDPAARAQLLELVQHVNEAMLRLPEISRAIADALESATSSELFRPDDEAFWLAFDRVLPAVAADPSNQDQPEGDDWVSLAINRSMGSLATALLNALFSRRMRVGDGMPAEVRERFSTLLSPAELSHRPARVVAASRLSYLFAIDPEWTRAMLLPNFSWDNEDEAISAWQGFAWQPRIDPMLWEELKPNFLPMFSPARLERIGTSGHPLAQMLVLVAIEFGAGELPRDQVREAIRAMDAEMRAEALSWIVSYMHQRQADNGDAQNPDQLWTERVSPWLRRHWPLDPQIRSNQVSSQLASIAIATKEQFPNAVQQILQLLVKSNADMVLEDLSRSNHPGTHPAASLDLIEAMLDPDSYWYTDDTLSRILDRIREADRGLAAGRIFRTWQDRLRVREP